jgi:transposase InsO family protein
LSIWQTYWKPFLSEWSSYAVSTALDTTLTLEALRMAIAEHQPGPGVIHYSDQGVQYAPGEYVDELKNRGFEISIARVGNPY